MEKYPMVIETTDLYETRILEDGRTKITIIVPEEFRWLWLCKLGGLYTTDEEIECYQNDEEKDGAPTECSPP
jgi:hypothetical protein